MLWFRVLQSMWIGLNDIGAENVFVWEGDRTVAKYTNWQSGEPNDHASVEDCVQVYTGWGAGYWNDDYCDMEIKYICELPNGENSFTSRSILLGQFPPSLTAQMSYGSFDMKGAVEWGRVRAEFPPPPYSVCPSLPALMITVAENPRGAKFLCPPPSPPPSTPLRPSPRHSVCPRLRCPHDNCSGEPEGS